MTKENGDAELERYGFRILPSGRFFSIAKGSELGVVHSKKRGRHHYHSTTGALLASGMDPVSFVKEFWYAKPKNPASTSAPRSCRSNPPTAVHEEYARKYLAETDDILETAKGYFEAGDRAQGYRRMLDAFETVSEGNAELVHLLEDPSFHVESTTHLLDDLSNLQASIRETILQGLHADPGSRPAVGGRLQLLEGGRSGNPDTSASLRTIMVLWRQPDTLTLWGIPYRMRPGVGQQPYDIWRATPYPPPKGWIYLGEPGWYGSMSASRIAEVRAFLAEHTDDIPGGPAEWTEISE